MCPKSALCGGKTKCLDFFIGASALKSLEKSRTLGKPQGAYSAPPPPPWIRGLKIQIRIRNSEYNVTEQLVLS